jgi:hypothetical protein
MKTYVWYSGGTAPPFLISVLDGGEWAASRTFHFNPVKELPVPIRLEGGWTPELMWTLWRKEKYRTAWESNPGVRMPVFFLKGIQEVSFEVRIR